MRYNRIVLCLASLLFAFGSLSAQTMVTKYLWEFATPAGGGYPNDAINDH